MLLTALRILRSTPEIQVRSSPALQGPRDELEESAGTFSPMQVSSVVMFHSTLFFLTAVSLGVSCMAQAPPRMPNVEAQRAAMKKLSFLTGKWSGEASLLRAPGQYVDLLQTEQAQFKLDGLVLMIEGVGRTKSDGRPSR